MTALSIYGQVACVTCKQGPPKDERGICALCLAGVVPTKRRKRADSSVDVPVNDDTDIVAPAADMLGMTPEVPTQMLGSDLKRVTVPPDAPVIAHFSSNVDVAREKRLARSKAWHAANKLKKKSQT